MLDRFDIFYICSCTDFYSKFKDNLIKWAGKINFRKKNYLEIYQEI